MEYTIPWSLTPIFDTNIFYYQLPDLNLRKKHLHSGLTFWKIILSFRYLVKFNSNFSSPIHLKQTNWNDLLKWFYLGIERPRISRASYYSTFHSRLSEIYLSSSAIRVIHSIPSQVVTSKRNKYEYDINSDLLFLPYKTLH